jgi:hypothetical protein
MIVNANVVPSSPILSTWWWRTFILPKRRCLHEPLDVTSHKSTYFIVTTVKTPNLTKFILYSKYEKLCNIFVYAIFNQQFQRITQLRNMMLYILVELHQRFGRSCCRFSRKVGRALPGRTDWHSRGSGIDSHRSERQIQTCLNLKWLACMWSLTLSNYRLCITAAGYVYQIVLFAEQNRKFVIWTVLP